MYFLKCAENLNIEVENTYNIKKKKSLSSIKQHSTNAIKDLIAGAATGVIAGFISNPISQIANMKASHPQLYANKSFWEVAKDLYKGNNELLKNTKNGVVIKGIKAFYPGFATQALKNAIFSAIMFATLPYIKNGLDKIPGLSNAGHR